MFAANCTGNAPGRFAARLCQKIICLRKKQHKFDASLVIIDKLPEVVTTTKRVWVVRWWGLLHSKLEKKKEETLFAIRPKNSKKLGTSKM